MNRDQAEQLRKDDRHWWLGIVYRCKDDPRIIVRNRWRFGWTWNFANPYVLIVLPLCVAFFLAPILVIAPAVGAGRGELMAMYGVVFLVLIGFAHFSASGPR